MKKLFLISLFFATLNLSHSQDIHGKWLATKNGDLYSHPSILILEFDKDSLKMYEFDEPGYSGKFKIIADSLLIDEYNWGKLAFFDKDRFTLFFHGTYNGKKSVLSQDFVRLLATEKKISKFEIEKLSFAFEHNEDTVKIIFDLDEKFKGITDNEKENFFLEEIDNTLFLTFYFQGKRENALAISKANEEYIELYAFDKKPYFVIANTIRP